MLLVMLGSVTGAWAQNNVIRYTATKKLDPNSSWWLISGDYVQVSSHEYDAETHTGVVTFESDIASIGRDAFFECTSLVSIELPASVTSIGASAFYDCTSLTSIGLPASLTSIGDLVFRNCTSLASIDLPGSTTQFGTWSFDNCTSLKTVTINSQQTLDATGYRPGTEGGIEGSGCMTETFGGQVEEYILKGNITTIPNEKFSDSQIKTITLPATMESIGDNTFHGCTQLESIYSSATTPPTVGSYAFDEVNQSIHIYVPGGSVAAYRYADGWGDFTNISDMKWEFDNNTKTLTISSAIPDSAPVAMPDYRSPEDTPWYNKYFYTKYIRFVNISHIGEQAFIHFDNVTSLELPNTVTSIGESAFCYFWGLTSLTLPNSVTNIGAFAFGGCKVLKSITVEAQNPPVVGYDCFDEVNKDIPVYVPNGTADAYRAANGWSDFTNILDVRPEFELADKAAYSASNNFVVDDFTYTRTFSNTDVWQCWYVPFEVSVDETKFKAAEIAGILFDSERNAVVAFNKLDDGAVLKANTPYVVKAVTENLEINLTDATLYAAEENTFTIQSAYDDFTIGGIYTEQNDASWYTLNKTGNFQTMGAATLKPQRFWMSVTPREDGPYAGSSSASAKLMVKMMVLGDDEVSGIEDVNAVSQSSTTGIYNLQGQKVSAFKSGQVYIMNGKKFIAK